MLEILGIAGKDITNRNLYRIRCDYCDREFISQKRTIRNKDHCGCLKHKKRTIYDLENIKFDDLKWQTKGKGRTGIPGVIEYRGGFRATIKVRGTMFHLGVYNSLDEAKQARIDAENYLIAQAIKNNKL